MSQTRKAWLTCLKCSVSARSDRPTRRLRSCIVLTMFADTFNKAQLPFILVACKCDQHPAHREVDPSVVEHKAKSFIGDVSVFQTSESSPEAHRACLSVITRAAIAAKRRK